MTFRRFDDLTEKDQDEVRQLFEEGYHPNSIAHTIGVYPSSMYLAVERGGWKGSSKRALQKERAIEAFQRDPSLNFRRLAKIAGCSLTTMAEACYVNGLRDRPKPRKRRQPQEKRNPARFSFFADVVMDADRAAKWIVRWMPWHRCRLDDFAAVALNAVDLSGQAGDRLRSMTRAIRRYIVEQGLDRTRSIDAPLNEDGLRLIDLISA